MTQPYYDFCVAAGEPSGSAATSAGQDGDGGALYTCRIDADGNAIRIVSTAGLANSAPGYLAVARARSGEQILYAASGDEISWFLIGDERS